MILHDRCDGLCIGVQTNSGTEHEETTMAYIGKFNYDYMGKYLFEYACRYDGSYRYAPGKRWAFSPSLSAGWRISEESFIKDNFSFIDNLKIRGSYGVIGEKCRRAIPTRDGFHT